MAVKLKTVYEKQEDVPEGYGELYTEKNGKFELTNIEGVKTQADIDRMNVALLKERTDHKAVRDKLQLFGDVDPTTLPALNEELAEAKARLDTLTAEGKLDEGKVEAQISAAVNRAVGPVGREKDSLAKQLEVAKKSVVEKEAEIGKLNENIRQEHVRLSLRDAVIAAQVLPTAIADAVLVTKSDNGMTPGLDPKEWAKDMKEKRPHWWPLSQGGGAQGGKGGGVSNKDNPWSAEAWNLTAQGKYIRDNGEEKGAALAARANSKIGAVRPTRKVA